MSDPSSEHPAKLPTERPKSSLEIAKIQAMYDEYAVGLQRFLLGILRDETAAADAMQLTFVKLMEKGHSVQQESSIKSWLFRVAFNEAMLIRRRAAIRRKHREGMAWYFEIRSGGAQDQERDGSHEQLIRQEDIELVREALKELSDVQRVVVEKRIYEGLKFREIADELDVPLGTVLARMQSSLKKLKGVLGPRE